MPPPCASAMARDRVRPRPTPVLPAAQPAIQLDEGLEDARQPVRCHADAGIFDRERQRAVVLLFGVERDPAAIGREFDGVRQQMGQRLPDLAPIDHESRQDPIEPIVEGDRPPDQTSAQHLEAGGDQLGDVRLGLGRRQPPGIDLR